MSYFYQDTTNGTLQHKTTYTYDTLNRLGSSIATPVSPGTTAHNLDFSYDRFGNMTCVMDAQTNGPCPNWTFNTATNRINNASFTYDAAGNLTQDGTGVGTHTYQWDAENRLKSVDSGSTATFTYNALGQRVRKQIPGYDTHYVWDASGQELGSYNGTGNYWWNRNFVLGGWSFAIYFSNYVRFVHANHLGTTTVVTDQTGAELQDQLFYPWGQQWTNTGTQQDLHFASLQQIDPDLGLYPTLYRMYSPTQGRWLSGDPDRCGADNPQTFDRYAYVTDNPTNKTDPLGLQDEFEGCDNPAYAITHAECRRWPNPDVIIDIITLWEIHEAVREAREERRECTAREADLPFGIHAGLCKNKGYVAKWAWACEGGTRDCCRGKAGIASWKCENEGKKETPRRYYYLESFEGVQGEFYAECCDEGPLGHRR